MNIFSLVKELLLIAVFVIATIVNCLKIENIYNCQKNAAIDVTVNLMSGIKTIREMSCIFECNRDPTCMSCAFITNQNAQTNCYLFNNKQSTPGSLTANFYSKQSNNIASSTTISSTTSFSTTTDTSTVTTLAVTTSSSTSITTSTVTTSSTTLGTSSASMSATTTTMPPYVVVTYAGISKNISTKPDYMNFFTNAQYVYSVQGYPTELPVYPTFDSIVLLDNTLRYYLTDKFKVLVFDEDWNYSGTKNFTSSSELACLIVVDDSDIYMTTSDNLIKADTEFTIVTQVNRSSVDEQFFRIYYDKVNDQLLVAVFYAAATSKVRIFDRNLALLDTIELTGLVSGRFSLTKFENKLVIGDTAGEVSNWVNKTNVYQHNAYPGAPVIGSINVEANSGLTITTSKGGSEVTLLYSYSDARRAKFFSLGDAASFAKFDRKGRLMVATSNGRIWVYY